MAAVEKTSRWGRLVLRTPWTTAALMSASTHAGARTSNERRHGMRGRPRAGAGSPRGWTPAGPVAGAGVGRARRSRTSSANSCSKSTVSVACIAHQLLESIQGSAQSGRARGRADSQDTRGRRAVEIEQPTKRDDLALRRGQPRQRSLDVPGYELGLLRFVEAARISLLAAPTPRVGAKVVERYAAGDRAEPRACASAARIEAPPRAESLLECLAGQVFGDCPVAGEQHEIPMHGVKLCFRNGCEGWSVDMQARPRGRHRVHGPHTPPPRRTVTRGLSLAGSGGGGHDPRRGGARGHAH